MDLELFGDIKVKVEDEYTGDEKRYLIYLGENPNFIVGTNYGCNEVKSFELESIVELRDNLTILIEMLQKYEECYNTQSNVQEK